MSSTQPLHVYFARRQQSDDQLCAEVEFAVNCGLEYAVNIARSLERSIGPPADLSGLTVLEVGPGLNFGAILVCRVLGARVAVQDKYLVAWNPGYHATFYRRLRDRLQAVVPAGDLSCVDVIVDSQCHADSVVRQEKTDLGRRCSFRRGRFDAIVSNAVLEHVWDVRAMARQFARITRPHGVGIHQVDFRDHSSAECCLDFLAMPDKEFARVFQNAQGGSGNRVRPWELAKVFRAAGFAVDEFHVNTLADEMYTRRIRPRLLPRYARRSVEELRQVGGRFFLRRKPGLWHRLLGRV